MAMDLADPLNNKSTLKLASRILSKLASKVPEK
jgi:hypothetical protein